MSVAAARWIPWLLSSEDKVRAFLGRYRRFDDAFLHCDVTTDETWMNMYDLESKQESCLETDFSSSASQSQILSLPQE